MSLVESAKYIRQRYSLEGTVQDIIDGINNIVEDFYFNHAVPKKGVPELLKTLASYGVRMAIATATDKYLVEAALKRNNIRDYFCEIVTSTEVGSGKDNPQIYETALKALKVSKSDTIVFEDLLLGLKTAKKAGFKIAGIYDKVSESSQSEIKRISNWYITDYYEWLTEAFNGKRISV